MTAKNAQLGAHSGWKMAAEQAETICRYTLVNPEPFRRAKPTPVGRCSRRESCSRNARCWSGRCFDRRLARSAAAVRGMIRGRCRTVFCGFWEPVHSGVSCRRSTLRSRPAIAVFSSGFARASSKRRCVCWLGCSPNGASSTWKKRSSMPRSRAPEKGFRRRTNTPGLNT